MENEQTGSFCQVVISRAVTSQTPQWLGLKACIVSIVLLLVSCGVVFSQDSKVLIRDYYLTSADRAQFFYKKGMLPGHVFKAIDETAGYEVRMADKRERWNPTDVTVYKDAPDRKFVMGAKLPDGWMVVYDHGGRGYHSHVVFYRNENSKIDWVVTGNVSDKKELADMFKETKFSVSYYKEGRLRSCVF